MSAPEAFRLTENLEEAVEHTGITTSELPALVGPSWVSPDDFLPLHRVNNQTIKEFFVDQEPHAAGNPQHPTVSTAVKNESSLGSIDAALAALAKGGHPTR